LAAMLFSIFATLEKWKVNPRKWLSWYLESCACNGGQVPPSVAEYLRWNLSPEQRRSISDEIDDSSGFTAHCVQTKVQVSIGFVRILGTATDARLTGSPNAYQMMTASRIRIGTCDLAYHPSHIRNQLISVDFRI
jgi:hypothetical protein